MAAFNSWKMPVFSRGDLCEVCHKKPKFEDLTGKHPYCSRSCARSGGGSQPLPCILDGCRETGRIAFADFCSESHARQGVQVGQVRGCECCAVQPRTAGRKLCISCNHLGQGGPWLTELPPNNPAFKDLKTNFSNKWHASEKSPKLVKAFEIHYTPEVRSRHNQYERANPDFKTVQSFHSSQCICDLGDKNSNLCNIKSCGICCTVRSSFHFFVFERPHDYGRFGPGIYTYQNPALADKYATSCTSSRYRVMISCEAIVEAEQCKNDKEPLFAQQANAVLPIYICVYAK